MGKKSHRIFLTKPVLNYRGKMQRSVFLGNGEFLILKSRAVLMRLSARELMTRNMQESRKLLDNKTEEALKEAFPVSGWGASFALLQGVAMV